MNAVQILWLMAIGACLMLAFIQALAWRKGPAAPWLALLSLSIAGIATGELAMMHAPDTGTYGRALRWMQVPVYVAFVAIVGYVRHFLHGGRRWLGNLTLACGAAYLLLDLSLDPDRITGLREIRFLGAPVKIGEAIASPHVWLAGSSALLLLAFTTDAALSLRRQEDRNSRHRAFPMGAGVVFFIATVSLQAALIPTETVAMPCLVGLPLAGVLAAMACDGAREPHHTLAVAETGSGTRACQRDELARATLITTLSELSGSLAHELNQPLAIILANAQAAQRILTQSRPDLKELKEILSDIVVEDRRAGDVIQRLRALLKRGATKVEILSLNDLATEVLHLLHEDLAARGITITRSFAEDLPAVPGNRAQLQQVLLNLILNGADAMVCEFPRTRDLQVSTSASNGTVRLAVQDTGIGLPDDTEQLFQPFYTTKADGLGMGLAICRSIASAHGGHLRASPHPCQGAIFELDLPAHSARAQNRPSPVGATGSKFPVR